MDDPGTLVLVSHDRFFLDQVSTHTLAWNPEDQPRWELYEGNPTSVRRLRAERAQEAQETARAAAKAAPAKSAGRPDARRKPGLSQKEERRLAELETAMDHLHARIAGLEAGLNDPAAFISADAPGHQAMRDRDAAREELEALEMEWLELEEKRTPPETQA
jgi:ATP-binding cassette subfamily F protein uup